MNNQHDISYNLKREAEERFAAADAFSPAARQIHLALAQEYANRASRAGELDVDVGKTGVFARRA